MSKKTESSSSEIHEDIRNIADVIKKNSKYVGDGKIEVDEKTYEQTLPEGVDMKTVKKLQSHNSNVVAGAQLANGEMALKVMEKESDIDVVSSTLKVGSDKISVQFDRVQEKPNGEEGSIKTFGVANASYTASAAGNKAGLKSVREHLATKAKSVLDK